MKLFISLLILLRAISVMNATQNINMTIIEQSFNYLIRYADINVESIVVIADEDYYLSNSFLYEMFSNNAFFKNKIILFLPQSCNKQEFQNVLSKPNSALFIVFNYDTSKKIHDTFDAITSNNFIEHCWLLVFSDYHDEQGLRNMVSEKTTLTETDRIRLDSQIYMLSGTYKKGKLYEVYRACSERSIEIKQIISILNGEIEELNEEFIWSRRKT